MTKELWEEIEEFPDYAVSNFGAVVNMKRGGADITPRPNQYGHVRVALVLDGRQMTRGLAPIVANTFVPRKHDHWDTPIHLDGDLWNCRADNLAWRPRWFAIKYHKQFRYDHFHQMNVPLIELESGETYGSVKEACVANGVHFQDVLKSYMEETFVSLTFQEFRRRIA